MKARDLFERFGRSGPAPVEAPPKPGVKPAERPGPARPATPEKYPDPWRRRAVPGTEPGPMPRPKARAKQLLRHESVKSQNSSVAKQINEFSAKSIIRSSK